MSQLNPIQRKHAVTCPEQTRTTHTLQLLSRLPGRLSHAGRPSAFRNGSYLTANTQRPVTGVSGVPLSATIQ